MNKRLVIGAAALALLSFSGGAFYGRCCIYSQSLPRISASFARAADNGHSDAQAIAGVMRAEELGCAYNPDQARAYWQKAAEKKSPGALYLEGYSYEMGLGTPRDYVKALRLYKQAAEHNHPPALRQLGYLYFYGRGVPADRTQGKKYLHQAAAQGDQAAKNFILFYRL